MSNEPVTTEAKTSALESIEPGKTTVRSALLFFFGIVLPAGTVVLEAMTGLCADTLFDPLPTAGHAGLALLVPVSNLVLFIAIKRKWSKGRLALGMLNGAAVTVAVFYTILFLPVLPLAVVALIAVVVGIGLIGFLPMTPLLSLLCTISYRYRAKRALFGGGTFPGLWRGVALGVGLLISLSMPDLVTRVGMRMASSDDADVSRRGIGLLRAVGNEDRLIEACHHVSREPYDLAGWLLNLDGAVTPSTSRDIYFRVTGKSFRQERPPTRRRGGLWGFDSDPGIGGDFVASEVEGLSLADSRIDGSVDADGALAYLEWIMVFRNDSRRQQEARATVELPPGGVVSRLTLWIDGEEREAAFGGRSRVRQAYKSVVRRKRDPVVVTTAGPDRIMVQCFPVPPDGGEMKFRIGMTAPLMLEGPDRGRLLLPRIADRNFVIKPGMSHGVFVESKGDLSVADIPLSQQGDGSGRVAVRGHLDDDVLRRPSRGIEVARNELRLDAWASDDAEAGTVVTQNIHEVIASPPDRLAVVIDGSADIGVSPGELADALLRMPTNLPLTVLFASDEVVRLSGFDGEDRKAAVDELNDLAWAGGQDNNEALLRAFDLASEGQRGAVLWIHGPVPYLMTPGERVRQLMERRPGYPVLYDIQTRSGPHLLMETLDGLGSLRRVPRLGTLSQDIARLADGWTGKRPKWRAARQKPVVTEPLPAEAQTSHHLARLFANDRVQAALVSGDQARIEAVKGVATRYQIVTPVSGAVVLETARQYNEAGLAPVAPGSVPTVPEPEEWALIFAAMAMIVIAVLKRRYGGVHSLRVR